MSKQSTRKGFASRPADPERWVKAAERKTDAADASVFTARLTIDVTPDQRARIKIVAFQRGVTVADMLRELLSRRPVLEKVALSHHADPARGRSRTEGKRPFHDAAGAKAATPGRPDAGPTASAAHSSTPTGHRC